MIKYVDECVGCGLPCLGRSCPNRNIPVYYCDWCKQECDPSDMRNVDGEQVCEECILGQYERVEV